MVWLVRTKKIRKEAAAAGKTFDEVAAEHEAQGIPFAFAERKRKVQDVEKAPGRDPPGGVAQGIGSSEEETGEALTTEKL